jgi:eukaryotic-like serine/threonine-protein kinase
VIVEFGEQSPATTGPDALLDGRYRLGDVLGRGGVATVYAAVDVLLGRDVAVKIFRPAGSRLSLYRFAAEARLLAGLSHPGLVTVHDVCLDGDRPYLVMHLVDGDTLRTLMDRGPVEPVITARIGARIADVLAYIHSRDIVHRDVKPSNVLVDGEGDGYLADFGIARARDAAHLTLSGELIGTAAYLAPEQVSDVDVTAKADVYALGLVLLECLTGRTEYTGTTVEAAVARLSRQPRIGEEVPRSWRGLLTAMTAREPVDRPDAAHCAGLFGALVRNPTAVVPHLPPRAEPKLPRAAVLLAALAGAVVFGVSGSTVAVPGTPTGGPPPADNPRPAAPAGADPKVAEPASHPEAPMSGKGKGGN